MRNATVGAALVLAALCAGCNHATKSTTTTVTRVNASSQTAPSATPTTASTVAMTASPSVSPAHLASVAPDDGAIVYQTNCSSCHQAAGQGMPGTFPPLAGNPIASGPAAAMIHIVKDGLNGAITVKGIGYSGQMPAWGQTLSASDLAAVLTYVRHSWGNHGTPVTPAQVSAAQ